MNLFNDPAVGALLIFAGAILAIVVVNRDLIFKKK